LCPLCNGALEGISSGWGEIQLRPTMQGGPANDRLDSWKEIASYLKKEVRTVQRWEKSMGLPVRRLARGKGTVFAYKSDLDAWLQEGQNRFDINSRTDRLRPMALLFILLIMAVPLSVFWPQIHDRIWPHRTAKFILAVQPFKNLSGDPTRDFVADGLTEEMIAWLGQLHRDEIGVIRLSSAYASSDLDLIGKARGRASPRSIPHPSHRSYALAPS